MRGSIHQNIHIDSMAFYNSGVYTSTVTDNNGCKGAVNRQVTVLVNPILTVLGDTVCLNAPAKLKVSGANTYLWYGRRLQVHTGTMALVSKADYVQPATCIVVGT